MDVVSLIIKIVLCIFSLFLIIVVLMQTGDANASAVTGGAEALMGKKKARGMDALLAKLTKGAGIGFMVLAVALVVIQRFAV